MISPANPFARIDKRMVIGALKATRSQGEDVLSAQRATLLSNARVPQLVGTYLMIVGGIATATVFGAPVGIPLLAAGWWSRRRGVRNIAAVEAGFHEYVATGPMSSPAPSREPSSA